MQYILDELEFKNLRDQRVKLEDSHRKKLQELCTLAAQHIPVTVHWRKKDPPSPWGCIIGPVDQDPGYCDHCPCREVCPHDKKNFSK